jgi:glycogenin
LSQSNTFIAAPDVFPPDKFNAGVMGVWLDTAALNPSAVFDDMMIQIHQLKTYDGGDTGFLNAYLPQWYYGGSGSDDTFGEHSLIHLSHDCRLPFRYNAQRTLHWMTHDKQPGYWEVNKPYSIIHFSSSPKPWQVPSKKGELELIWWQYFMLSQVATLGGVDLASMGF